MSVTRPLRKVRKRGRALVLAVLISGLNGWGVVASGHAAALGLDAQLRVTPDLSVAELLIQYSPTNNSFTASGLVVSYDPDGAGPRDVTSGAAWPLLGSGAFNLNATITTNGTLQGGTVTLSGAIPGLALTNQLLLTGNLTQLGFQAASADHFEFGFSVTGGALAGDYGSSAGVIMDAGNSLFESFNCAFTNNSLLYVPSDNYVRGGPGGYAVAGVRAGVPAAPTLRVELTATNTILIAWPASASGYELEENSDLGTTNWTTVGTTPVVVGSEKQVVQDLVAGTRFYRLHQP